MPVKVCRKKDILLQTATSQEHKMFSIKANLHVLIHCFRSYHVDLSLANTEMLPTDMYLYFHYFILKCAHYLPLY